jgi:UDP-GlcNAc:undecaprenyl-phosphate/decaprenyl-phosphate GlcNAc-1-phosphate transferase
MILSILAFFSALLIALVVIPFYCRLAMELGLVDRPDKLRKLHGDAIPMVGGLALVSIVPVVVLLCIFLGTQYTVWFTDLANAWSGQVPTKILHVALSYSTEDIQQLIGLTLAATLLMLVGALDDRFNIRGRQKLLGQFIAVTILILAGFQFEHIYLFGFRIEFGVFSGLIIYLWIIAAINSVNLLDGADGIASMIGLIMSLAIAMMAIYSGQLVDAIIATAIGGTLMGFLRFNFPPAKAYLGDSGSMLIGLLLSALSIRCMFKGSAAYAFLAPLALLAIPFIDTAAAIIRRRLTGRSIFTVDRGHLHHSLLKRGYSPRASLLWVAMLTSTTSAGAILSLIYRRSEYALLSIVIVLCVMITFRIFGWAEYQLVTRRAHDFASSFFRTNAHLLDDIMQGSVHVQGNRNWKEVWRLLFEFAEEKKLAKLTLDVNAPWLHESFHATRNISEKITRIEGREWRVTLPLIVQRRACGRVEIHASGQEDESHHEILRSLLAVLNDIEFSLSQIGVNNRPPPLQDAVPSQTESEAAPEMPSPSSFDSGSSIVKG